MTKRPIMITITTSRIEVPEELFDGNADENEGFDMLFSDLPEPTEMMTEGRLATNKSRVELIYDESEISGMAGSVTSIGFDREAPGMISMMRTGPVRAAMIFESGKRHFSVYDTPFSSFQVCVRTLDVKNALFTKGEIDIDYLIEIHGAQAERCRMNIAVKPLDDSIIF